MTRPVSRLNQSARTVAVGLGSVELLPPEADAALKVATEAVLAKRHTQKGGDLAFLERLAGGNRRQAGVPFGIWAVGEARDRRQARQPDPGRTATGRRGCSGRRRGRAVLAKRRTQRAILAEFNAALAAAGIEPVPSSTFNRWVVHVVRAGRHQRRTDMNTSVPALSLVSTTISRKEEALLQDAPSACRDGPPVVEGVALREGEQRSVGFVVERFGVRCCLQHI